VLPQESKIRTFLLFFVFLARFGDLEGNFDYDVRCLSTYGPSYGISMLIIDVFFF